MSKLNYLLVSILFSSVIICWSGGVFAQPIITSFSPTADSIGSFVTISGTALNNPVSFIIGGKEAKVISNDGNTLVGMVMPGSITGKISVTTAGGNVTSADNFTVTPFIFPAVLPDSKLVGTGFKGNSYQGISVSLSADGKTALVGGNGDNGNIGAAWIFTRTDSTWVQQGSKLVGSDYSGSSYQGTSVSLSADGNTALVGGYGDSKNIGAAWIFTRSGGIWTQQGGKLVGTDYIGMSAQGYSVSLSSDGKTALVGGYGDNGDIGAAWIYTRNGNTWTQQGSKLVGTGYTGTPRQGLSVSLSANSNTAIVGGYLDNSNIGAVWIYNRTGNNWTEQVNRPISTPVWDKGGICNLAFSQLSLFQWAAGGENSFSGTTLLNFFANYKKGNYTWDNTLDLGYGITKQVDLIKKGEDRIDFSSKFGKKASENWYSSALIGIKTQFTAGYNYPNDSVVISDFFSPAYLTISIIGMDYRPSKNFSILMSPFTGKMTFVMNEKLSANKAFGIDAGKKTRSEFGGFLKASYKKTVLKKVDISTKIDLFSNYIKNPQNIDVNWELMISMKILKYLSATFNVLVLYDDDIKVPVKGEKTGPGLQVKEVSGIGLSYKF